MPEQGKGRLNLLHISIPYVVFSSRYFSIPACACIRALTAQESVTFLRHLYGYLGRRLLVIWDNATIHRSDEVKAFLANGWATRIHLENFPAYAPKLNPDEGVWHHLKHVELRNLCCMDLIHLNIELQLAIRRLRREQDLIQSFFARAGLDLGG